MHRCTQGHVLHGTEIPNGPESKAHVNTLQKMKKHSTQCSQTRNGQTMPAPDEERQQGTKGSQQQRRQAHDDTKHPNTSLRCERCSDVPCFSHCFACFFYFILFYFNLFPILFTSVLFKPLNTAISAQKALCLRGDGQVGESTQTKPHAVPFVSSLGNPCQK